MEHGDKSIIFIFFTIICRSTHLVENPHPQPPPFPPSKKSKQNIFVQVARNTDLKKTTDIAGN